jgi:hypothetical protein
MNNDASARIGEYTVHVRKWMLLSLLVVSMGSESFCRAQDKGVIVEKLPLDKNPEVSRRCRSNFPGADWVDDNTILVSYQIPPCGRNDPFKFGITTLDVHGKTLASTDRDTSNSNFQRIELGSIGELLAISEHTVQVLDAHFGVLKTIDYASTYSRAYLSADRTGFALCGAPTKNDCRYFRGRIPEEVKVEDFPEGFPEVERLKEKPASASTNGQPIQYPVSKDESWFFDRKGNVFRVKKGGQAEKLPSPAATSLDSSCGATLSEEGHDRLLAHCHDQVEFGGELLLYDHERIVLYDVPTGKVLLKLDPGEGNSRESLSPNGKRIEVVRGGVLGGRSSVTIYYVP